MKILFSLLLLTSSLLSFSQKVEVSDSLITVDGNPYAKISEDSRTQFTVYDISGKASIVIKLEWSESRLKVNQSNPRGSFSFTNFYFLESKQVGQLEFFPGKKKKAASQLVKFKFFQDGKLKADAVDNFVLINPVAFRKG